MRVRNIGSFITLAVTVVVMYGMFSSRSISAASATLAELTERTHFHGIAVDPSDPSRVLLATHHGLYAIAPDGMASQVSGNQDDYMGFTPHPTDPSVLYASGHPAVGGNLGFITSSDAGRSWKKLSDGAGGPVDFHQMDVSKADPKVVYGVFRNLQRSADGGSTWTRVAPAPVGIIDLAASSQDADTLYAATQGGLFLSTDGGRSFARIEMLSGPTTMVHVTHGDDVYAFVVGSGLIRAAENGLRWQVVSNDFGDDYLLHLATDPGDGQRLYAITTNPATRKQGVIASHDGGATWATPGTE